MTAVDDPRPEGASEAVESGWRELRAALEDEWDRISEEIRSYPPPIPACDAQFNYLLERRDRVSRELGRLNRAAREPSSLATCRRFVDRLVESSDLISAGVARELRSHLRHRATTPLPTPDR